ncbi:MAG: peptidoglycan DD-metalloendopeptidase family protein [Gammaproteobacteria bacterium]|nr:peptidoglycan DD-metalloendopeptidase family protein [Gammaproteobacteria bacterium]
MNHSSFINYDIKSHAQAPGTRPKSLRFGYLLLAGLTTLAAVALLTGNSEPARAIQTSSMPLDEKESIVQDLALPQDPVPVTVAVPTLLPEASTTSIAVPDDAVDHTETTTKTETSGIWHNITIKSGDNLATIFSKAGIPPQQLHSLLQQGGAAHNLKKIYPGQTLSLLTDKQQGLVKLVYPIDKLSTLEVNRNGDDFDIGTIHRTPEHREVSASGTITSSLFMAAHNAGLSDKLTMELANIFGWDIDFALDIRKGDRFTVLYQDIYLDGERIDSGDILAAEFVNQGKQYRAVRYTDAGGRTDYYALDGTSMRKTFLRTPVEFSRISSGFSTGRKHPILNKIRAHQGVDYAASTGTPIKTTANGKIVHLGKKGGYGNTIVIQHGSRYSTLYAHMSKFRSGLKVGSTVQQGQTIGYVGSSGLATGPHLHYELRVDGTHRDPLRVKLPGADPLNQKYMADFRSKAEALMAEIELASDVRVASTN